jgi:hypothetical protein
MKDRGVGAAVCVHATSDRELVATKRSLQAAANEAVGAVGADDPVAVISAGARPHAGVTVRQLDIQHPLRVVLGAVVPRSLEQRAIERAARDHHQRRIERGRFVQGDPARGRAGVVELPPGDGHGVESMGFDRVSHESQRPARDAAAAGLLARMGVIEQSYPRTLLCQATRRPRARRSSSDH